MITSFLCTTFFYCSRYFFSLRNGWYTSIHTTFSSTWKKISVFIPFHLMISILALGHYYKHLNAYGFSPPFFWEQPSILAICPDPNLLAEQLTHIELERLSHIGPEEFVQVRNFHILHHYIFSLPTFNLLSSMHLQR